MAKKIYLAYPRGFCAGVRRALDTVEEALKVYGRPVYVLHEIVHNDYIVNNLKQKGVIFVENLSAVPCGSPLIFSAHGVSGKTEKEAAKFGLKCIDATCPLVKKIHKKALALEKKGFSVFLIGHRKHPEISGTLGQLRNSAFVIEKTSDIEKIKQDIENCAYLTQTTLSLDDTGEIIEALKKKYPGIDGGGDICYATQNRQNAVKMLAEKCDTVFIIGSPKSSNSNRLKETAEKLGIRSYLINNASEITPEMLAGSENTGISAGASAPECLVEELIEFLEAKGWTETIDTIYTEENVKFSMPLIKS